MTRSGEEEEEETDRLGKDEKGGGHLERDETWRAVEMGMEKM